VHSLPGRSRERLHLGPGVCLLGRLGERLKLTHLGCAHASYRYIPHSCCVCPNERVWQGNIEVSLKTRAPWRPSLSRSETSTLCDTSPDQLFHRLVDDRVLRAELALRGELGAHDLVIGELAMAASAQQDLTIACRAVDQLTVRGIDPGHQIALEPSE